MSLLDVIDQVGDRIFGAALRGITADAEPATKEFRKQLSFGYNENSVAYGVTGAKPGLINAEDLTANHQMNSEIITNAQNLVVSERMKLEVEPLTPKGIKPLDVGELSKNAAKLMAGIGATYQERATLKDVEQGPKGNGSILLAHNAKDKNDGHGLGS
jgi:hypothetical protein